MTFNGIFNTEKWLCAYGVNNTKIPENKKSSTWSALTRCLLGGDFPVFYKDHEWDGQKDRHWTQHTVEHRVARTILHIVHIKFNTPEPEAKKTHRLVAMLVLLVPNTTSKYRKYQMTNQPTEFTKFCSLHKTFWSDNRYYCIWQTIKVIQHRTKWKILDIVICIKLSGTVF